MLVRIMILLLLSYNLHAQTFNAAPFQGMGNTGLALESIYSLSNNSAGISKLKQTYVALAYQPHFISSEINSQALFFATPIPDVGAVGFSANNYGIRGISSLLTARAIYARSIGPQLSTSISANYHSFSVKNYGRDNTFSFDLGFQFQLDDRFQIGALARNISKAMFEDDVNEYLPYEVGLGFAYELSKQLSLTSDVYYNWEDNINYRGGLAYDIDRLIILRAGVASNPIQYFAGIGIRLDRFLVDISSAFHTKLGSSPQIALAYGF